MINKKNLIKQLNLLILDTMKPKKITKNIEFDCLYL